MSIDIESIKQFLEGTLNRYGVIDPAALERMADPERRLDTFVTDRVLEVAAEREVLAWIHPYRQQAEATETGADLAFALGEMVESLDKMTIGTARFATRSTSFTASAMDVLKMETAQKIRYDVENLKVAAEKVVD